MFLSDVFRYMPDASDGSSTPPELHEFYQKVSRTSPPSPSQHVFNVLLSVMLKQVTVWDRLVINIREAGCFPGVLAGLNAWEKMHGDMPSLRCPVMVKRRPVTCGMLEIEVTSIDMEEVWGVFPAPRALYFFALDDVDDIRSALSLSSPHEDASFSTVLLLKVALGAVEDLKTTIENVPCRIVGWKDLLGVNAQPEVVAVVATGEGILEI